MLPSKDHLTICFAHVAYRLRDRFLALATGIESFEVRDGGALEQRIGDADVLVISGLWRNELLPRARRSSTKACGSRAPGASMPARSPSMSWR